MKRPSVEHLLDINQRRRRRGKARGVHRDGRQHGAFGKGQAPGYQHGGGCCCLSAHRREERKGGRVRYGPTRRVSYVVAKSVGCKN